MLHCQATARRWFSVVAALPACSEILGNQLSGDYRWSVQVGWLHCVSTRGAAFPLNAAVCRCCCLPFPGCWCVTPLPVPPAPQGVTALQEATEAYLVGLFEDAQV